MSDPTNRPRPKPGQLPLEKPASATPQPPDVDSAVTAARSALPPFLTKEPPSTEDRAASLSKLKKARRRADELAEVVREEAFDDWVRRCVVEAKRPDEWTQARDLYESYVRHVARYGANRSDRAASQLAAATETRFGKMLGSLLPKIRRSRGWFYPVRIKKGA